MNVVCTHIPKIQQQQSNSVNCTRACNRENTCILYMMMDDCCGSSKPSTNILIEKHKTKVREMCLALYMTADGDSYVVAVCVCMFLFIIHINIRWKSCHIALSYVPYYVHCERTNFFYQALERTSTEKIKSYQLKLRSTVLIFVPGT